MADRTDYGKIIVLTGAGASTALGMPTMASFLKLIPKVGDPLSQIVGRMSDEVRKDAERIYTNLEVYAEFARTAICGDRNVLGAFGSEGRAAAHLNDAVGALSQLQRLMLEEWGEIRRASEHDSQRYCKVLKKLRELNEAPLRVFTTNYDLTFEHLGYSVDDGTMVNGVDAKRAETRRYAWEPMVYHRDVNASTKVVLYRLHGCSHWFAGERGGIFYKPQLPASDGGPLPMVIFPELHKSDQAYRVPFTFAYNALREAIGAARICVVIGCSFRDEGVVDVLRLAAHERGADDPDAVDTQFVVVDPAEANDGIFRKLVGWRVTHIRGMFGAPTVNDCLLSTCERLLRDNPEYDDLYVKRGGVTQVPGCGCWECPGKPRACKTASSWVPEFTPDDYREERLDY